MHSSNHFTAASGLPWVLALLLGCSEPNDSATATTPSTAGFGGMTSQANDSATTTQGSDALASSVGGSGGAVGTDSTQAGSSVGTASNGAQSTGATLTASTASNSSSSSTSSGGTGGLPFEPIAETIDIGEVWSGHPVDFALVTTEERQFIAFYAANRDMTVGSRVLGESSFELVTLPTTLGWDSHNYVTLAVDSTGHVHVSGNMHNVPLIYFRTTEPWDITTLTQVVSMVGPNEQNATYPEFFHGPDGTLIFAYRDGGSGNGNHIFNKYDTTSRTWSRLLDTPFTDGEGMRNAYPVGPVQGPDGSFHLVWVWRDTPDASTNHDLSYARTRDLLAWETGSGQPLSLPITLGKSDIVDPVPAGGGMINNNTKVGFDAENRPVVVYHKYDQAGNTQLFNARLENGEWVPHQTSDWDYRWDFGGGGTLIFEIEVEGVQVQSDGTLTQRYYHAEYGGWGAFRLDPLTLAAEASIAPPLPYPAELDTPESTTPGMVTRWQHDAGQGPDSAVRYMLRWETLPENRDMPRDPIPEPTLLRLYGFRTP